MKRLTLLLAFVAISTVMKAQDDCANAIVLNNVNNWCSGLGAYTNVGATPTGFVQPNCFSNDSHDVWFRFTAIGRDVTITVRGLEGSPVGGTLQRPEMALYFTNCNNYSELRCVSAPPGQNIVTLYRGGLTIGQTYYIRIDGFGNNVGTFQLCVNNYTAPATPGADCPDAAILCDKSGFVVQNISGVGGIPNEGGGTCFDLPGQDSENASTWFQWTCDTSGPLTFDITPLNPTDDIDFVVYELPNGLNNCSGRIPLRCEAASCIGPTGLSLNSVDLNEDPNCDPGEDNYVAAVNMVAGRSYAMLINNFSNTGNGFSIEFGGTGSFLGPTAQFSATPVNLCLGESITVTDLSIFPVGNITSWDWIFGVDATPLAATTRGPHSVSYTTSGIKYISLTISTNLGCVVSAVRTVRVGDPPSFSATLSNVPCYDSPTGSIALQTAPGANYTYQWSTGANTATVTGLQAGTYSVTVANLFCDSVAEYTITGPPEIVRTYNTRLATCNGGTDGGIFASVSGGVPFPGGGYQYNWENTGYTNIDSFTNVPIGFYTVMIQDAIGCIVYDTIEVEELELIIDSFNTVILDPSCYGYDNGRISLLIGNGRAPFSFDWGATGNYVLWDSVRNDLVAGTYHVVVRDANFCYGDLFITLNQPDTLQILALDSVQISCFGENDGQAIPTISGGTQLPGGGYLYQWSPSGQTDSIAINLVPGWAYLTVTDDHGCTASDSTFIVEPPDVYITAAFPVDALCFGDNSGTISVIAGGGTPGYLYSANNGPFQTDSILTDLISGTYTVYVQDARGCEDSLEGLYIGQPFEIIVNAGDDRVINLGDSTQLGALVNSGFVDQFQWSPDYNLTCDTCKYTWASPYITTVYHVTVTDDAGCTATDSVIVRVLPVRPLFIPNAFTPNVDGINDGFRVFGGTALSRVVKFLIFDRWGELVYSAQDVPIHQAVWDGTFKGKAMNTGTFVYLIEVEYLDGWRDQHKGEVYLIR